MRTIGLHLRITSSIVDLIPQALELGTKSFQCFMIHQGTGNYLELSSPEIDRFLALRDECGYLYAHASYWVNLSGKETGHTIHLLRREIEMAKALHFNAIVIHPGAATGWATKQEGIDQFVRLFNALIKNESNMHFIIENTAHGNATVGSDLEDLKEIYERLEQSEKVSFCLDTAHAYAYGYDIGSAHGREQFLQLVDQTITADRVSLIHLNDSSEKLGTKKDRHELLGKGNLGQQALKEFTHIKAFAQVPLILELPPVENEEQAEMLELVRSWCR
ncbi:MAG TPA: deoxyribonuclease IV [Candidatus Babeliales bacterium]|nr:deoxyribonuclease IV [Candidatus Babeliales bacterium]